MMLRRNAEIVRSVALCALLFATGACEQRQGLVDPEPGGNTAAASPVLPGDSVLREGVILRVGVRAQSMAGRVTVLLVDSAREVAWRSDAVPSDGGVALVPVRDLPAALLGRSWLMTAFFEGDGRRTYALSDTSGATTLANADLRAARVYAGRSIALERDVRSLVASSASGVAYFTGVGDGAVRSVDVRSGTVSPPVATDRGEVWDIAVVGGTLAYLADAGSRVGFVSLTGAPSDSSVLGPLEVLAIRSTVDEAGAVKADTVQDLVRPYATSLRLSCLDDETVCGRPVALLESPTQGGGSVIRLVSPREATPVVLIADHDAMAGHADSVPSTIRVAGPRRPDGSAETLLQRGGAAGCLSLRLGLTSFDADESGSLFSGGGDDCGPVARVARIDGFLTDRPKMSRLAGTTMAAEDRIRRALEIVVARDGSRVLVREEEAVWLLDRDLRVLGFKSVSSRARIAWVAGARGESLRFVIADQGRLEGFEADRFGLQGSVSVGPLAGAPLAALAAAGGAVHAVFVPAGETDSIVTVDLGQW
jgi:hypothetical protein